MIREIQIVPKKVLRKKTKDINEITPDVIELLDDLYDTMVSESLRLKLMRALVSLLYN